jgi:signal peptide peptidase SppA
MMSFSRAPIVPVVRLAGPIGMATPLRPGLSLAGVSGALDRAFSMSKCEAVAVTINSPGGSPVQSNLIFRRIRQLATDKKKRVYVFCEDVAASGGYFIAIAGDEIYVDPSSIVGSIGVISATFGFDKALDRLGIERRLYTSGTAKSFLDPFAPERPEDVARLATIQREIHATFIAAVKERRAGKLTVADEDVFSGAFWTGSRARDLGLVDGVDDIRSRMQSLFGPKVKLKPVAMAGGGLLSKLRRLPAGEGMIGLLPGAGMKGLARDALATLEERAMWSRYGL